MDAEELSNKLEFHPVTPERWGDLETLFGKSGACGGCWCMWWRLPRQEYEARRGEGTHAALKCLVAEGRVPGLLAYAEGQAVGWVSVGPREDFVTLERSRLLKRVDDKPVWSVVCFFVARRYRGQGVTVALLQAAVDYAKMHGARLVEGYPSEPDGEMPAYSVYTGLASAFRKVGFVEVARRSAKRPIMRYIIL